MTAVVYNVEGDVGSDIVVPIAVTESDGSVSDLTGYTGAMNVKTGYESDATLLATGTVAIDMLTGVVTGTVLGSVTASASWRSAVYDLKIVSGSDPNSREHIARGRIQLRPTVT